MAPATLLSLPDELLRAIFHRLNTPPVEYPHQVLPSLSLASTCQRLRQVFRQTYNILQTAYAVPTNSSLYVPTPSRDLPAALHLLSTSLLQLSTTAREDNWLYVYASLAPPLLSLTLTDVAPIFPLHLALSPTLKSLTLIATPLQSLSVHHANIIAEYSPALTSLSLAFAAFPDTLNLLFSALSQLTTLRLSATQLTFLTAANLPLLTSVPNLPSLHTLHLSRFDRTLSMQLSQLCEKLPLQALHISQAIVRPADLLAIASHPPSQFFLAQTNLTSPPYVFPAVNHLGHKLVSLRISMPLGERLLHMLADKCPLLRDLRCPLSATLTDDAISTWFSVLAPQLEYLTLINHVEETDMRLMASFMNVSARSGGMLKELRVSAHGIDLNALGALMRKCNSLIGIMLRFLGREGVEMDLGIVEAIRGVEWVKVIDVDKEDDTQVDARLWQACARARMRGCKVTIRGVEYGR